MNEAVKDAMGVVEEKLQALVEVASTEVVRVKLRNIHDVCSHLVVTGKQRLTVPSLLSTYAARFPAKEHAIAESSVRNKRGGANPYLDLYRAWESAAEVLLAAGARSAKVFGGEILDLSDIAGIPDPATRHQVKLLIAQNRSLKSQLDILKQVRGAPMINLVAANPGSISMIEGPKVQPLTESEIEALKDFVSERKLKGRGLVVGDDGSLTSKDGRTIADPGFVGGLKKILEQGSAGR